MSIEVVRSRRPAENLGLRYNSWSVIPALHFFHRFDFNVWMPELVWTTINAAALRVPSISFRPSAGSITLTAVANASESIP